MPNQENKSPLESSGMDIPDYAIERMARCLLPMMQKYYESTEGKEELAAKTRAEEKLSA